MSMFDDIEERIHEAAARALNQIADGIAADSERETPHDKGELRASALYPGNDPASRCEPDDLVSGAMVSYNTVYAAAQHEGWAEQHWIHPRVPIIKGGVLVGFYTDTSKIKLKDVIWVVKHHTEPGTKTHFLEDPLKAKTPRMELFMAASIDAELK